jgi:hypothetical protein
MHLWVYDPHSGGVKIPTAVQQSIERRVRSYADAHYGGKFTRLELRFRSMFCYIDAYIEPMEPENVKILVAFDEKLMNTMARTICRRRARFIGI